MQRRRILADNVGNNVQYGRGLAESVDQKEKANKFFQAIEATYGAATLKKGDSCAAANTAAIAALDEFVATL